MLIDICTIGPIDVLVRESGDRALVRLTDRTGGFVALMVDRRCNEQLIDALSALASQQAGEVFCDR